MGLLNREAILAANDLKYRDLELFGGTVRVRELSQAKVEEYIRFTKEVSENGSGETAALEKLIIMGVVDEDGRKVLQADDGPKLRGKSQGSLLELFGAIADLSGFKPTAAEEIEKNSAPDPVISSSTA